MEKLKLNRLSDEVVRQIAAGEVIERPASIVKELVDNAIDAEADRITIKVKNGGIDLVEVSDNGIGIPKENLSSVFEPHTTTKLKSIEDLNTLLSMGFRGEALSTITSVAKVKLDSKYKSESIANQVFFNENGISEISSTAKEEGTTIKVENLFYNIPARRKYLKTAQTEYRKIYELLNRYFLIYPNVSFVLYKDEKIVVNLKKIEGSVAGELKNERVAGILGKNFSENMLELFYDGAGVKINGYISHPSSHRKNSSSQYIFLNNRGITDRGISRAIMEGYSRYLPFGQKVDFVLNIVINPELVDINVHPRKEEVRFENPFRMYSAVEEAVRHTLEKNLSYSKREDVKNNKFQSLRDTFNSTSDIKEDKAYKPSNVYSASKQGSVEDSLLFTRELFKDIPSESRQQVSEENGTDSLIRNIFQIFNKYIVIEFTDENLWIIDQHAAAERINFEKLSSKESSLNNLQNLLVPADIPFNKEELLFLEENQKFFKDIGFIYEVKKQSIELKSVPAEYATSDYTQIFKDIFELEENVELLRKSFLKRKEDILATISCHGSVRAGQKLSYIEMKDIYKRLEACNNPYSCPHGRPIIWRMDLREIDTHFERTY